MQDGSKMKSVNVNGFDMTYVEQGEGDAVIFLHGTLSDHRAWDGMLPAVPQGCRALAPDLRYNGTADWPGDGSDYGVETHAKDVTAFIETLGLDRVTMIGWSHGGGVSLVVALQNPGLVERMFLYEPGLATLVTDPDDQQAILDDRTAAFGPAMALAQEGDVEGAVRTAIGAVNGNPDFLDELPASVRQMILDNARTMPLLGAMQPPGVTADDVRALDIPVKIVIGGETRTFLKIMARCAVDLLPQAEFEAIEGAVHFAPAKSPDALNPLLVEFLSRR
jgi:pimeloyl-ACP methyl ester carboxylesterase